MGGRKGIKGKLGRTEGRHPLIPIDRAHWKWGRRERPVPAAYRKSRKNHVGRGGDLAAEKNVGPRIRPDKVGDQVRRDETTRGV